MAAVNASYYTDPADPLSWALEPAVRKLQVSFGAELHLDYVMGGLAREFGPPAGVLGSWLDAAADSGMPVDLRLWLTDPPHSSYPACLAVKAAAEQGEAVAAAYLRRLREGFACERRKLDNADALVDVARSVPELDAQRFRSDLQSHATVEGFGADIERAEAVPAEACAPGTTRVRLPSIEFRSADGVIYGVYGLQAYDAYRDAARAAGAPPAGGAPPGVEEALRLFPTLATPEVAAVCELPGPRAAAELWRLASEWKVSPGRCLNGELWRLA